MYMCVCVCVCVCVCIRDWVKSSSRDQDTLMKFDEMWLILKNKLKNETDIFPSLLQGLYPIGHKCHQLQI